MKTRLLVAGALLAGTAFTAAPASAVCLWEPDPVFGTCGPCGVIGLVYGPADHALRDKLPPIDCAA
jgi:hypothetical protein